MPTVVRCSCGQALRVGDERMGKAVACPACGAVLTTGAPAGITAALPLPPPAAVPPPLPRNAAVDDAALGEVLGVWIQPSMIAGANITVLTEYALCTGSLPAMQLKEAKRRLSAGAAVPAVLGGTIRVIPLAALQAVQVSNKDATLALGFLDGQRRAQHTIQYHAPIQRWVFAGLRERLGRGWHERSAPSTVGSALGVPLTLIGLLLFLDLLAFGAALQQESGFVHRSGRGKAGGAFAALIGSTGFLVIGVLLLVAGAVWLVFAIRNRPPALVTLTRASEPAA